jgi:hypothetical protein
MLVKHAVAELGMREIGVSTLERGDKAPSGVRLAREAGCHPKAGDAALRLLLASGALTRGVTPKAWFRAADPDGIPDGQTPREEMSRSLAAGRSQAGLTPAELPVKLSVPLTAVRHAEAGRLRQAAGQLLSSPPDMYDGRGKKGARETDRR